MKRTFSSILLLLEDQLPSVATLTADERGSWAKLRELVKMTGKENAQVLEDIEAATFIICLDDESPSNPSERCNQFIYSNPTNRWSDKPLQSLVCENGASGFVCEHTMIDLTTVAQVHKMVVNAILDHKPQFQVEKLGTELIENMPEELLFEINSEIMSNINRIGEDFKIFKDVHKPAKTHHFHLPKLSNTFFRSFKIVSKAGCHLVIQLAALMHFGCLSPCWEALTTLLIRQGRWDWLQVVSPRMFDFCTSMVDGEKSPAELKALLYEAANTHGKILGRTGRGRGFLAQTRYMREMVGED